MRYSASVVVCPFPYMLSPSSITSEVISDLKRCIQWSFYHVVKPEDVHRWHFPVLIGDKMIWLRRIIPFTPGSGGSVFETSRSPHHTQKDNGAKLTWSTHAQPFMLMQLHGCLFKMLPLSTVFSPCLQTALTSTHQDHAILCHHQTNTPLLGQSDSASKQMGKH